MTESDGSWVEEAMMVVLVLVLGVQRVHGACLVYASDAADELMRDGHSQSRHSCQSHRIHCSQHHNQRRCPPLR